LGKRKVVEKVNGGDNSTYSKYTNPNRRAIHIHGGMEHNLVGYAKYYSCGSIEITRSSEFTRETNHNRKEFSKYCKQMLKTSYTLNMRQLLKIALELTKYLWQKLKPKKIRNLCKTTIKNQVGFSISR